MPDLTVQDMVTAPMGGGQLQDPGPLTPDELGHYQQTYGGLPPAPQLSMQGGGFDNPQLMGMFKDIMNRSHVPGSNQGLTQTPQAPAAPGVGVPGPPPPPRGTVLSKSTQTSVQGGPTPDQLATDTQTRGEADLQFKRDQSDLLQKQAERYATKSGELKAEAAHEEEQRARAEGENAAKMTRLRQAQDQMRKQEDEPIDPSRYYHNLSAAGKVAAVLAAGIHGFLNPRGGPAPVIQQMMEYAHQDTMSQIENRNSNERRRAGIIDQYQAEYGDATMVAQRLDADKLRIARKQLMSEDLDNQSADVQMRRDELVKGLAAQEKTLRADVLKSQWQKPVEVSNTYERPKPTGGGTDLESMKKMLEIRGKQLDNRSKELENASDEDLQQKYGMSRKDLGVLETYRKEAQPLEDMRVMGNRLASTSGLVRDEDGHWVAPKGSDVRGVGLWDKMLSQTELSNSPDRDAAFLLYKGKLQNTLTGAAATESEAKRIQQMVDSMTEKNFVEKFNEIDGYFNDRLLAIPVPSNVRSAYRRMQRESSQERASGFKPVQGRIGSGNQSVMPSEEPEMNSSQNMSVAP